MFVQLSLRLRSGNVFRWLSGVWVAERS